MFDQSYLGDVEQVRDAGDVYRERARENIRQPTQEDWYQQDRKEDIAPSTRGDEYTDSISCLVFPALRLGLMIQAGALAFALAIYHGHGGRNAFTFDLYNLNENLRTSSSFALAIVSCLLAYLVGTGGLLMFQSFVQDNGKFARGFRAGSKVLNTALLLDMFSTTIRLLSFVYGYHFLAHRWWLHYSQTKADFSLFNFGSFLHGLSLVLYGVSFFYMENYHDEGTYEEFGWGCLSLYGLAGLLEISTVVTGYGAFAPIVNLVALIVSVIWAMSFEPLLHFHAAPLHDRMVNDDLICNAGPVQEIETSVLP